MARTKPILAMKSGVTRAGSRAASSHTAALAGSEAAVAALFRQAGVIRSATLEELVDVAALLSAAAAPARARGVAVLTNAGGLGILCADACDAAGLELPQLAEETRAGLAAALPAEASVANPVDMLGSATADLYEAALPLVLADPAVDAVVVIFVPAARVLAEDVAAAVARASEGAAKPVLPVLMAAERRRAPSPTRSPRRARSAAPPSARRGCGGRSAPSSSSRASTDAPRPRWCAGALARADDALARARRGAAAPRRLRGPAGPRAARREAATRPPPPRPSSASRSSSRPRRPARTRPRAAASRSTSPTRRRCAPRPRASAARCSCRRWSQGGVELLAGIVQDPVFGPLVAFGPGGVLAELIGEARFRLAPLTDVDAAALVAGRQGRAARRRLPRPAGRRRGGARRPPRAASRASAKTCPRSPSSTSTRSSPSRRATSRSTRASASAARRPAPRRRPGEPEPGTAAFSASRLRAGPDSAGALASGTLAASTRKGEIVETTGGNETTEAGWPASAPPEPRIDLAPGRAVLERVLVGVDSTPESLEAARQASSAARAGAAASPSSRRSSSPSSAQAGWAASEAAAQLEADAHAAFDRGEGGAPGRDLPRRRGARRPGAHGRGREHGCDARGGRLARDLARGRHRARQRRDHAPALGALLGARGPRAVRRSEDFPRSIVVGVDGSPESELAAAVAFRLGERFGVEVWPIAARGGKDFDLAAVNEIATNVLVEDASPVDALVAGAGRADLLVVGNRGLHGVRALGSVSERVAHQAPCSVLVVRRPAP